MLGYNHSMHYDIFTLFPEVFTPYLRTSILKRAEENGLVSYHLHQIRDWTTDRHHTTDDEPYGGGGGMVMKPEPIFNAVEGLIGIPPSCPLILVTPQGRLLSQALARELSQHSRLGILAARYEGIDERVREHLVTDEISIGDYVLTGGELPALVMIDAITRLIPGVLGDSEAPCKDSHASGLLEHPHYTRPATYRGWDVPEVLRSGNHALIERWRKKQSIKRTWERRPELLDKNILSEEECAMLEEIKSKA